MSYHVVFVLNFMVIFFSMKILSWRTQSVRLPIWQFFFLSPFLSARPHPARATTPIGWVAVKFVLASASLTLVVLFANQFLIPLNWWRLVLIAPLVYFLTEVLGAFGEMLFSGLAVPVFPIHNHPLRAVSIGDFWGRRWNIWVQDWLRDITAGHTKNLKSKLFLTFFASGLFHELMGNLPWYLYYRESYFGNMMLYFTIQGLGLWIEKRWVRRFPTWVRRLYLWALVILPAPIFMNKPLLTFLGIIDG